jgi:hypothetical protein
MNGPETGEAEDNGDNSFEDEDPGPTGTATEPVHLIDSGGEETTEGAGNGGGGEEDSGADTELRTFIPAGEVVVYARKEASFCEAEEPLWGVSVWVR